MTDTLTAILDDMGGMHPLPKQRPEVEEITTPSGLTIRYEDKRHLYFLDGEKVASVTSILGVLDKPALPWWGMRIGVEGVLELYRQETLRGGLPLAGAFQLRDQSGQAVDADSVVKLLTEHRLTVNHVRDKAGERGVTVHDALEAWATTGQLPNVQRWPEEQRGFVQGLALFLHDAVITPEQTEVMVGSKNHSYAGRYDLRATLGQHSLITDIDKKGQQTLSLVPGGSFLVDLKTSSSVYPEHFLQLEAYEGASVECGYKPTDFRAVLHVTKDGKYQFKLSPATHADFLAVNACYQATVSLKARVKAA